MKGDGDLLKNREDRVSGLHSSQVLGPGIGNSVKELYGPKR